MRPATICIMTTVSVLLAGPAASEPEITDPALRESVDELASSTLVDGEGWEAYEQVLHPDYSRWAMGTAYEGREEFIANLKEWWDYGMRVASREIDMVGVDIVGDLAIIRFKTTETFVGPEGPAEGFTGFVTNVWVKERGDWMLLSAEISTSRN